MQDNARLSNCSIASAEAEEDGYDEIPDFDVESEPFMEFRLYYKSLELLDTLRILDKTPALSKPVSIRKERPGLAGAAARVRQLKREATPEVACKQPRAAQVKLAVPPVYESRQPAQPAWLAKKVEAGQIGRSPAGTVSKRPRSSAGKFSANKRKKTDSAKKSASTVATKQASAVAKPATVAKSAPRKPGSMPPAPSCKTDGMRQNEDGRETARKVDVRSVEAKLPSPPPTPPPEQQGARAPSPAASNASSLPSIGRMLERAQRATDASRPQTGSDVRQGQATPGPAPRIKQEEESSHTRRRAGLRRSPSVVDLTFDSDAEEANGKMAIAEAIAAETLIGSTSQAGPPNTASGRAGVPRLVQERRAAEDLLAELDINDDSNVQALLETGYKSRESFLKRLPRLEEGDRSLILGDLRRDMGKVDYGSLALPRCHCRSADGLLQAYFTVS